MLTEQQRNKQIFWLILLSLVCLVAPNYLRAEPQLVLKADSGLVIVDRDTLVLRMETRNIEVPPGEHRLRYYPLHRATGTWENRYIDYLIDIDAGSSTRIDLGRRKSLRLETSPSGAEIIYRGKALGWTPGDYLFLDGRKDKIVLALEGYRPVTVDIDGQDDGKLLEFNLQPFGEANSPGQVVPLPKKKPFSGVFSSPALVLSLGTGVGMLAAGAYFNNRADDHYDRYLRILNPVEREKAFKDARRDDRLSQASFITGNVSLAFFGYLLLNKYVFNNKDDSIIATGSGLEHEKTGVGININSAEASLSLKY